MRRRKGQLARSFFNGLVLATLPVAAFLAVDYLIAPPAGDGQGGESAVRADRQAAEAVERTGPAGGAPAPEQHKAAQPILTQLPRLVSRTPGGAAEGPTSTLAASIQGELQRVGCYQGVLDGQWNERTRSAMQAFNSAVRVNIATDKPDYLHLTLLQGHSARACTSGLIEARASQPQPQARTADAPTVERAGAVTTSSIVVPFPIVTQKPAAPAAVAGGGASPVAVTPRTTGSVPAPSVASSAPSAGAAAGPETATLPPATPLPGRMAVGAFPGPDVSPADPSGVLPPGVPLPPGAKPKFADPRASRPPPRQGNVSGSAASPRLRATFSDLSRAAP